MLVGVKLLVISCIRIATDLKYNRSKGRKLGETSTCHSQLSVIERFLLPFYFLIPSL